ncbi:MAG: type VI secretion system contractile sheath large subunit [Gammaproteobacteria bacterium]
MVDSSPQRQVPGGTGAAPGLSIALIEALAQLPSVTDLRQFLATRDDDAALRYWIVNCIPACFQESVDGVAHAMTRQIAEIDRVISEQLNHILHHPKFQKLEASWRGLWMLVEQADEGHSVKVKVLDASWADVVKDVTRALEFDQSQLFHKVYSEEYGMPGGEPYGALIGDYEISHQPSAEHPYDDISALEALSQIAAASFSPFIAAVSSRFFGLEDFAGLGQPINIANIFTQNEYIRWRSLRDKPDSRFVGLTLPKTLMRLPYTVEAGTYKGVHFHEQVGAGIGQYLWGNGCYAFGAILIREFSTVGWFGHIRGVPRNQLAGGLVTTLPVDRFRTDPNGVAFKPVTDVVVTDTVEKELSDLGFIPLCQCYQAPFAAFYNNQSVQQSKLVGPSDSKVNAKLSTMLQHIFCGSRIAHYLKVMFRDKVGSFVTVFECEKFLHEWLLNYTTGREDFEWEDQARYPLREADVKVRENPMNPGQYLCEIRLRPHYQLDHMVSELELVTELASVA